MYPQSPKSKNRYSINSPKEMNHPLKIGDTKFIEELRILKMKIISSEHSVGGNVCFHKSLIEEVGGFDETFTAWGAEDTEFGFRVYNHGYCLFQ